MRWSIIRLIWFRELRDQLRDRRTLFMIAVLPLLLYPVLGFVVLQFAVGLKERTSTIGIVQGPRGTRDFPEPPLPDKEPSPRAAYPPLIRDGRFTALDPNLLKMLTPAQAESYTHATLRIEFLADADPATLESRKVDLLLRASDDFYAALERGEGQEPRSRPILHVHAPRDDESSRQAADRLDPVLKAWERTLRDARLERLGLPDTFDQPVRRVDPDWQSSVPTSTRLFNLFVRIFPFMLVMWALAGALYPAVDLCAGEKERGTMETLLISPAGREEIVFGKFLTIWVFSAGTSFLNLISMGLTTWQFSNQIPTGALNVGAILWCIVLVLPLSAFFSAISLALGAYARSSKEGQYYLMPLFLVTMPLVFLTLAPGVTLSPFYSLVPVTGVALLMQRLMTVSLDHVPWLYFVPVLAPIVLYSWIALRWAIDQFHREEVLFREAERLDVKLWLQRLFRDKEPTPTPGQALFLFGAIIFLRWLSLGVGSGVPPMVHTAVSLLAFVATPTLIMTVMLNTRPAQTLALRSPKWGELGVAAALALVLLPPLAAVAQWVFSNVEDLRRLLEERQPMVSELRELREPGWPLLVFALLPAVCEELAFRGFILTGLMRRLRPRNAILLSSFLFALFHMNVFQFLPSFLLGVVLGLLTVRSKSLLPAMIFHLLHNALLIVGMYLVTVASEQSLPDLTGMFWLLVIGLCVLLGAGTLWWLYRKPYVDLERELARGESSSR